MCIPSEFCSKFFHYDYQPMIKKNMHRLRVVKKYRLGTKVSKFENST